MPDAERPEPGLAGELRDTELAITFWHALRGCWRCWAFSVAAATSLRGGPNTSRCTSSRTTTCCAARPTSTTSNISPRRSEPKRGQAALGATSYATRIGRSSRCTRSRSSKPWQWLRSSRWGGSTSSPRWRRRSTPGTIRLISRAIWRSRAASVPEGLLPSKASPNT